MYEEPDDSLNDWLAKRSPNYEIVKELRAIKATLSAIAIKIGAMPDQNLTGDDIHDAISKSISRQVQSKK